MSLNEQIKQSLDVADLHANPVEQFRLWLDEAWKLVRQANAMTLATADKQGRPTARMVLLKGLDDRGFVFYGNYNSRKGIELEENAWAALVFWWDDFERQVRVEGITQKISAVEADEYFQSRPRGSQLGAWASPQSQAVSGREELDEQFREIEQKYENQEIPRPPYWGGWRVIPHTIEFWQGRPDRMHDRLVYHKTSTGWQIERLAP